MSQSYTTLKISLFCCVFGMAILGSNQVYALPPEGFETYTLSSKVIGGDQFDIRYGYVNPSWMSDYTTFNTYYAHQTGWGDYVTYGASVTTGNNFADRSAYFLRYDLTFSNQSLSVKFIHTDYKYIQAGKNIATFDYNGSFAIGSQGVRLYFVLGAYFRATLNRWNSPTWSPFNFNTDDREYYPEMTLGMRFPMGDSSYWTFDVNTRDAFNSYNGDNEAVDLAFNFYLARSFYFKLIGGNRFSGLWVGTGDIGELYSYAGFTIELN